MSAVFTVYSEMSHGLLVEEAMRLRAENAKLREVVEDAHFLLCFGHQDAVVSVPPMKDGRAHWRVWHLDSLARRSMNRAEQQLYDSLIRADVLLAGDEP
jgi:hypothetical protein